MFLFQALYPVCKCIDFAQFIFIQFSLLFGFVFRTLPFGIVLLDKFLETQHLLSHLSLFSLKLYSAFLTRIHALFVLVFHVVERLIHFPHLFPLFEKQC